VVAKYFFTVPKKKLHFGKLWRTKKFRIFVHHMLDEMYLMKKADIVHAIKPIPRDVRDHLNKLNALRNALAHSFFPENRRENRKTKKVLYAGVDIFTYEGVERFEDDWQASLYRLEGYLDGLGRIRDARRSNALRLVRAAPWSKPCRIAERLMSDGFA
jgi:hypothetical protein